MAPRGVKKTSAQKSGLSKRVSKLAKRTVSKVRGKVGELKTAPRRATAGKTSRKKSSSSRSSSSRSKR